MRLFAVGLLLGIAAAVWWLRPRHRSVAQRVEEEWRVPVDPYVDGLPW